MLKVYTRAWEGKIPNSRWLHGGTGRDESWVCGRDTQGLATVSSMIYF